ncbi:hypothetical protein [Paenibacillus sp. GXUN7292]|uniref:hypothetical protein n=1 Tax=Paenibacillus sp. GXUN7292 TaxID=3422499 RepID=UPI003D7F047B
MATAMKTLRTILIALCIVVAGCSNAKPGPDEPRETPNASAIPSVIRAEKQQDDFVYRLIADKEAYVEGDTVTIYAELEYVGEKEQIDIYHAASPFYFPLVEKTRNYSIPYAMNEPLIQTTLIKGEPLREEYKRSGGYSSSDDPKFIEFMMDFVDKGFAAGLYEMDGSAHFYVEQAGNMDKTTYDLKAKINFTVNEA